MGPGPPFHGVATKSFFCEKAPHCFVYPETLRDRIRIHKLGYARIRIRFRPLPNPEHNRTKYQEFKSQFAIIYRNFIAFLDVSY
jgi:hypothetical protein